jgi:hypothetical protein
MMKLGQRTIASVQRGVRLRRVQQSSLPTYLVVVPVLYLVAQIATGTDLIFSFTISVAIFAGLLAVPVGGGLRSAFGALNALLIFSFLLLGVAAKVVTLQRSDSILLAPRDTAFVMAIGFAGLLVGTWIQKQVPLPFSSLMPSVSDPRMYLALSIVTLVLGSAGFFIGLGPELSGQETQTGGILGVARAFSGFSQYSVFFALYYAWGSRSKRFLSHRLVLFILLLEVGIGIVSTSKERISAPIAFFILMGFLRYGFRDKRVWTIAVAAATLYALVIYPYAQYVRHSGGREGDLSSRAAVMGDVLGGIMTDDSFRSSVDAEIAASKENYLHFKALAPFDRFAMVGLADTLVAGTNESEFTGWETITWGFKLMIPSFIYPDKPIYPASNFLAHIAHEVSDEDYTTQVSYGIMANFYNAFSFPGVFFGTAVFMGGFYYLVRMGFGNPLYQRQPAGTTAWFVLIIAHYHHMLVESSVSGLMPSLLLPLDVFSLWIAAKGLIIAHDVFSKRRPRHLRQRNAFLPAPERI